MNISIKGYGFFSALYLFFCKCITLLFYPKAKIIRLPFFFRGAKNIEIGKSVSLGVGCRIESYEGGKIYIGDNVQINDYLHLGSASLVFIDKNCLIASKVFITDHNHGNTKDGNALDQTLIPQDRKLESQPVKINQSVWIGENVVILPGVEIGEYSIIGASAVVTKSVPPFSIACGNPARVIKYLDRVNNQWISVK